MPDTISSLSSNSKASSTAFPGRPSPPRKPSQRQRGGRWKRPWQATTSPRSRGSRREEARQSPRRRHPQLDRYTPDAFAAALKQLITAKQPKLVLLPHTTRSAISRPS